MEQTVLLDVDNPVRLFALHTVFTAINSALNEFVEMLNNHRLSTGRGWTPNDFTQCEKKYGEDPDGLRPMFDAENGGVVEPVQTDHST